jgi:hypothetical protein
MPKIVVEGPDGRKFAFPDTMPRAEINAFMKQKYGTKAPNESVQDYLARFGREQAATEARVKDIDREATVVGRAEGERAAERMGVDNPLMMAFAAPAIGLAQQEGGRRVFEREGTVLADEAAGLSAINAAGFFVPGMVNREFGARVEEGRRQQPLAAFAGDIAGGFGPGEIIGAGVAKAAQAVGPSMAALGRMFSGQKISPEMQSTLQQTAMGSIGGSAYGNFNDVNQDGVIDQKDVYAGAVAGGVGLPATVKGAQVASDFMPAPRAAPRVAPDAMPAGGYFGRQSMRPPGSGPSPREIEIRQQWSTATPIVTQARTTAQTAQQAAEAALQSKAPADIARAKAEKKALVGQLQEAQASRAGMDTPEDARLAETLASLTENTSDPVLLSTQISAAKTSLDRLLTDIGSPVEGNLIPVKTNILTRTQAPRSAAEGPQDRASVTRYAEGGDEVKPQGFGAGGPKGPEQADYRGRHLSPDKESGAPLHEVNSNGIYPDDVYSPKGLRYYGTATSDAMDRKAFELIQSMRGKPDATVTIYRAVPTNIEQSAMQINPNDWVTISKDYAKLHGDSVLGGDYKIVSKEVKAKDTYTAGDSWLEWGWSPEKLDDLPPISPMGFGASPPKTPQQAARFETPGSPEYEAAVAKGLDMSQAGRMARAKEMGFDTETVLYHGTGSDIKAFNTSENDISSQLGPGIFFTKFPESAGVYADAGNMGNSPNIIPVYIRGNIVDRYKTNIPPPAMLSREARRQFPKLSEDDAVRAWFKSKGIDGLRTGNWEEVTVFDPSNIRSVNAAFDPEKSTSSTLLAASPFAAVGGAGLTSERELGSKMQRDKKD